MIDTYTMIYLAAGLSVVFGCIALPIVGGKLLRQLIAADAAADAASAD